MPSAMPAALAHSPIQAVTTHRTSFSCPSYDSHGDLVGRLEFRLLFARPALRDSDSRRVSVQRQTPRRCSHRYVRPMSDRGGFEFHRKSEEVVEVVEVVEWLS